MELTPHNKKKITLTEIWPCGSEGEEMAMKGSSLFSNIQTQKLFRHFLLYNLAPMWNIHRTMQQCYSAEKGHHLWHFFSHSSRSGKNGLSRPQGPLQCSTCKMFCLCISVKVLFSVRAADKRTWSESGSNCPSGQAGEVFDDSLFGHYRFLGGWGRLHGWFVANLCEVIFLALNWSKRSPE